MTEAMGKGSDKDPRGHQVNVRLSAEEHQLLEELAEHQATPPAALARTILVKEVRRMLGPRNEEELTTAILDEIARFERLHGIPMPIENLSGWVDAQKMPGIQFKFNAAIQKLVDEGKVTRLEPRAYTTMPTKKGVRRGS